MSDLFGFTRTVVKRRYALLTPDGFVPSNLPGWKNAVCVVNISPAMTGPRFTQLHVTLEKDGTGEGNTGANQYFIYVLEGSGTIDLADKRHRLEAGSFVYLPPGKDLQIKNANPAEMKVLVFQKKYVPQKSVPAPDTMSGHEREVKGQPFLGNEDARLQVLLPDHPAFDMAVNIFTYQPGATLPFVETSHHGARVVDVKRTGDLPARQRLASRAGRRRDLDGGVLSAMVCGDGQDAGELHLLQRRQPRPHVNER